MSESDTQKALAKGDDQNNSMNHNSTEQMAAVVGKNIQQMIDEQNKTVKCLAMEADVNYNQLQLYLRGKSLPTISVLHRICKALGCSLDTILPMNSDSTEPDSEFLKIQAESVFRSNVRAIIYELSNMAKRFGIKSALLASSFSERSDAQAYGLAKRLQDKALRLATVVIEAKGSPSERKELLRAKICDACSYAEIIDYLILLLEENNCLKNNMNLELSKEFQNINKKLSDLIFILNDKGIL